MFSCLFVSFCLLFCSFCLVLLCFGNFKIGRLVFHLSFNLHLPESLGKLNIRSLLCLSRPYVYSFHWSISSSIFSTIFFLLTFDSSLYVLDTRLCWLCNFKIHSPSLRFVFSNSWHYLSRARGHFWGVIAKTLLPNLVLKILCHFLLNVLQFHALVYV